MNQTCFILKDYIYLKNKKHEIQQHTFGRKQWHNNHNY